MNLILSVLSIAFTVVLLLLMPLLVLVLVLMWDVSLFLEAPYHIKANKWWSYIPGSGFVAWYKSRKPSYKGN